MDSIIDGIHHTKVRSKIYLTDLDKLSSHITYFLYRFLYHLLNLFVKQSWKLINFLWVFSSFFLRVLVWPHHQEIPAGDLPNRQTKAVLAKSVKIEQKYISYGWRRKVMLLGYLLDIYIPERFYLMIILIRSAITRRRRLSHGHVEKIAEHHLTGMRT